MDKSLLHYNITDKLGEGGMGLVYLAQDTKLKRKVALKFLPHHISHDPAERKRFHQEAQASAVLNHPNIAQVYAIEECDDELFIVIEYVEGKELKQVITEEHLTEKQKWSIALQIAEGLSTAHSKGIVHRDIKSGNIMIDQHGKVKIMDFGLARIEGTAHITRAGTTVGTTAYMSPEQLAGYEVDPRSDIWAYGVVLYELFTGHLPFNGVYEQAIMYAITEEDPVPISETGTSVPLTIEQVIEGCLQKDSDSRYQSMDDITGVLSGDDTAKPVMTKKGAGTGKLFSYSFLYAIIPLLLLLLFFMYWSSWFSNDLPAKRYLAVLPIENIGNNPELQAICEGLAETLSFKLSELERFESSYWVTPASEIRKEKVSSVTQANRQFGVNLVVVSSIQTMQDSTRLILELVDADNVRRLGTEQVVVASQNLASLEQNGVRAMLKMLDIEINPRIVNILKEGKPQEPEAYAYYLKGRASLQKSENIDSLKHAIRRFGQSIAIDSVFALGHAGLGEANWRIYAITGDVEYVTKAKKALTNAININEGLAPVQALLGMVNAGTGEHEKAIGHYKKALALDPNYTSAYRGLAGVYGQQGKAEQAIQTFHRAIALKPDYWQGYKDLGSYYLSSGSFDSAITQFQKVIDITPKNSAAYSNLGTAYYYSGNVEEARQMFEQSLALENNPITANNLAGIYYWEGNYEQAANMYEIALEAFNNRYEIWGNLGGAYDFSGQDEKSRAAYLTAIEKALKQLEVNPNDPKIMADLGAYYSDVADTSNAIKYIKRALGISEDNIMVRQRAVSTYEQVGKRDEALRWINASMISDIELQPELKELTSDPRYQELKTKFSIKNQE